MKRKTLFPLAAVGAKKQRAMDIRVRAILHIKIALIEGHPLEGKAEFIKQIQKASINP